MRTHGFKRALMLTSALAIAGCGQSPNQDCHREALEQDLNLSNWQGQGVDASGKLAPGKYMMSSTFLALTSDPAAQKRFQQLLVGISTALQTQPGLVGYQVGTSSSCNTARTLSVWVDTGSMLSFSAGPAHSAAVAEIGALSRGGSAVTHWSDDQSGATMAKGASQLATAISAFLAVGGTASACQLQTTVRRNCLHQYSRRYYSDR